MVKVAFVGWRGLVGSVLMKDLKKNNDFEITFVQTINTGSAAMPTAC